MQTRCEDTAFVVLQARAELCKACFSETCTHKFRSTIGKSKQVKRGCRVLVAVSGGASSSAMMDMVKEGVKHTDLRRELYFRPSVIHVDG